MTCGRRSSLLPRRPPAPEDSPQNGERCNNACDNFVFHREVYRVYSADTHRCRGKKKKLIIMRNLTPIITSSSFIIGGRRRGRGRRAPPGPGQMGPIKPPCGIDITGPPPSINYILGVASAFNQNRIFHY